MGMFSSDAGADRRQTRRDRGNVKTKFYDKKAVVGKLSGCSPHQTRNMAEDKVNKLRPVYRQPMSK